MAYSFTRSITFDHTKCGASNSTNFPALFFGTYSYLKTVGNGGNIQNTVSSGGQTVPADLKFTSDNLGATLLKWEVESYDATTGEIAVWIKIPTMSHTVDTVIYMFYGDASVVTFQGDINGTWNSNFSGVWHLANGGTLTGKDSTSNANDLTVHPGATATTGQIYGGANGTGGGTSYLEQLNTAFFIPTTALTLSCWIKTTDGAVDNCITSFPGGVTNAFGFRVNSGVMEFFIWVPATVIQFLAGSAVVNDGNWHYVVGTFDGSIMRLFVDGVADGTLSASGSIASASGNVLTLMAREGDGSANFNGQFDEPRVNLATFGADWILTEFHNQNSPSTFYTVGTPPASGSLFRVGGNLSGLGSGGPFFHDPL